MPVELARQGIARIFWANEAACAPETCAEKYATPGDFRFAANFTLIAPCTRLSTVFSVNNSDAATL